MWEVCGFVLPTERSVPVKSGLRPDPQTHTGVPGGQGQGRGGCSGGWAFPLGWRHCSGITQARCLHSSVKTGESRIAKGEGDGMLIIWQ